MSEKKCCNRIKEVSKFRDQTVTSPVYEVKKQVLNLQLMPEKIAGKDGKMEIILIAKTTGRDAIVGHGKRKQKLEARNPHLGPRYDS